MRPLTTILLAILVVVAALATLNADAITTPSSKRELIQFCHSDGRCTTAAGAFWAEVDSVDAANFFGANHSYNDEELGAHAGL